MASSQDIFCGICERQEKMKQAVKWCPECDEGLCTECEKFHLVAKSSCHHKVISITDYKMLPSNISSIEHYCQEHQREFKHYCPQHDKLCCPLCISSVHNNCSGFMALEKIAKDAKTSILLDNIEQSLIDTKVNIEQIIKDRKTNLAKIREQRQKIQDKIKQTRTQINNYLDELEKKTIAELDTSEQSLRSKIDNLLAQLTERYNFVEELKKTVTNIKSHASDLQAFFGTKQLESQVNTEVKYIMSMADDDRLQQIDLKYTINENIADILTIPTFGPVTMIKGKTTVVLRTEKDKEAQIISVVAIPHRDINSINLKLIRQFEISVGHPYNYVTGCDISPNGSLAIADFGNRKILTTNDHGGIQSDISVPTCPFNVTYLHDKAIAFSSLDNGKINILDTTSKSITKSFTTTSGACDGITNRQGTIIYCERDNGIKRHELETGSIHTVVKKSFPRMTHITTNGTNIYHTNAESNTVTCYNLSGGKVWEFKDISTLNQPFGVDVDKHSNIYLASYRNNSIVVISSDGKNGRQLLKDGDIIQPRGLAIDKERGILVVACYTGKILLYDIS